MIQQTATDKRPEGNYNEFARRLGVDVAQLHRVLTSDRIPGPKFLGRLKLLGAEGIWVFVEEAVAG